MAKKYSRRDFLRVGAMGAATAVLAGCQFPTRWINLEPYVRPPEEQLAGEATWYASTCRQCPAGCGVIVRIMNGRALKLEGNPEHPLNQGKLCGRGQAGLQLLYNPDRLRGPVQQAKRGTRQFQSITWNEVINTLSAKLQAAGSGVAIWGGSTVSGHVYDLFQRLAQAMSAPSPVMFDLFTSLHGYRALTDASQSLFGQSQLPAYSFGSADVVLSFGSDLLGPSLSQVRYGAEYGRFRSQPLGKRGYLVQLEPRLSITGAKADLWLPIRPGAEGLVAQAIARIIADQSLGPAERVTQARALAGNVDVNSVAAASDISVQEIMHLAGIFANAERPLAIPGDALTGQNNAVEAAIAVQALNVIAGAAGGPSGLALSTEALRGLVTPNVSSYAEAQKLIERMRGGEVKVLLVHGANPLYDLPKSGLAEAIGQVPFVVSFSPLVDETAVQADLVLPDRTYLESWGYEVVSPAFGTPVVGSQQPVVMPLYDTRSTGDVLLTVARSIPAAAQAMPWTDEVAFIKDAITKLPSGAAGGSGPDVLWSRFLQHGGWWPASPPAPAPLKASAPKSLTVAPPQFQGDEKEYPYLLYPHLSDLLSDGRGANLPWLQGSPDPMTTVSYQTLVEMHPDTAKKLGVQDADVVKVASPYGEIEAVVYTYPAIRPDTVAIATGEGHTDYGRYARDNGSNLMNLVGPQADATGNSLQWSTLRVKITPAGRKVSLAIFEFKPGVMQGFINQSFPGQ